MTTTKTAKSKLTERLAAKAKPGVAKISIIADKTGRELVAQLVSQQQPVEPDCYWTVKDIAAYLNLSIYTVRRNFLSDPRWPAPLTSGNGRNSRHRWLASEVKKALLLFRR
ncbi:hypothetical protein [Cardiobacterium hominis]|uniref:hypothetical protein n=1 Tax=Cardiobacterium hominis TaxID=2718 RepID=UPI0028E99E06|nr:hypothetical protein [Cardiobacterium hominis]